MDKERPCANNWGRPSSSSSANQANLSIDPPRFPNFSMQSMHPKWKSTSNSDYGTSTEEPFQELNQSTALLSSVPRSFNNQIETQDDGNGEMSETLLSNKIQDWDPRAMLINLSFLEDKIHQLQDLVHLIVGRKGQVQGVADELVTRQQQLINADLTSIIAQLISTAGSLLPFVKQSLTAATSITQLGGVTCPPEVGINSNVEPPKNAGNPVADHCHQVDLTAMCGTEQNSHIEEHEAKEDEDMDDGENLPPGSYEILQLEKEEILAPHTHFCTICGKGFKRDANLRMHMRGHGDEYKTPAALAKPHKESSVELTLLKRYSCPFVGCKRNKEHKKFQPLKTILCVKNHYKRTHCDKSYTCSRCHTKKFSVMADLKTHEKHCGKDKWLCSCGTTFSRKDKLFGHVALFQGHTPAIHSDENKATALPPERGECKEAIVKAGSVNFSFGSPAGGDGVQGIVNADDSSSNFFTSLNFDTSNFGGFPEFPRPLFDDSDNLFSFHFLGNFDYTRNSGGELSSNNF